MIKEEKWIKTERRKNSKKDWVKKCEKVEVPLTKKKKKKKKEEWRHKNGNKNNMKRTLKEEERKNLS